MTKTEETKLSVLVSLFNWIQKTKPAAEQRSKIRKFLDTYCDSSDYFSVWRLILPSLDRERGSYGLKESVLANYLIDALGMSKDSADAIRLLNWRKGGAAPDAGNFPMVASEVLQCRQGMISGGLTIKELNDLLDCLALRENSVEKTSILSTLIKKTNAQEMKWIIMIFLKDAKDLFNVTCDLKLVCEKLKDRSQRHKWQMASPGEEWSPSTLAFMELTIQQAKVALDCLKVPVGCVILEDGKVIAAGRNRTTETRNLESREIMNHLSEINDSR